ncbi:MAG: hypothetical protein JWL66_1913 [Sphingomonadales bacterium]|nr:hypothetical protein [Sphingomonadales bacterium]
MFGFGKVKKEATLVGAAAARVAIMPFWDMFDRAFDKRIWSDPYVVGLIHGSIGAQMLPLTGRKLSMADEGFVMLDAMRSLGADQSDLERSLTFSEAKGAEFARGYDNAMVTFFLMSGNLKEELYLEPDIVEAKQATPGLSKLTAFMSGPEPRHPDQELALAYIHIKVRDHKKAYYPRAS